MNRLRCEQPLCTTLTTMLGFGSVKFVREDRPQGYVIRCEWEYRHAGIERTIRGLGVNEREALFDAAEQQPEHPVVKDPVCSKLYSDHPDSITYD